MNEEKSTGWRLSMPSGNRASRWRALFVYQGSHLRGNGKRIHADGTESRLGFTNFATGGGAAEAFERRQDQQRRDFWTVEQGADLYEQTGHQFDHERDDLEHQRPVDAEECRRLPGL